MKTKVTLYNAYDDWAVAYHYGGNEWKTIENGNEVVHPNYDTAIAHLNQLGYTYATLRHTI